MDCCKRKQMRPTWLDGQTAAKKFHHRNGRLLPSTFFVDGGKDLLQLPSSTFSTYKEENYT